MLFRLDRSLNHNSIRLLRLDPGHNGKIASLGRKSERGLPVADAINPHQLSDQLRFIRGQTAIITGRIEGDVLITDAGKANTSRTSLETLRHAAADADVNLIILDTASATQPDTRGLFGNKTGFPGLERALQANTTGEFVEALALPGAPVHLTASRQGTRYIALSSRPQQIPVQDNASFAPATAHLLMHSILMVTRDRAETREHDARFYPWLPTWVPILLLINFALGIMSWSTSWSNWWYKIWQPVSRESRANWFVWNFIRIIRIVVFLVVFLPLVGIPAFLVEMVMGLIWILKVLAKSIIWTIKLPIRIVQWATKIVRA